MQVKRIWQSKKNKVKIELYKMYYGLLDRPAFLIISPDGDDYFPSFDMPENGDRVLNRLRELRVRYDV